MTTMPSAPSKADHLRDVIVRELRDGGEVCVIARSSDSPVVRALDAAAATLSACNAHVRVVFLQAGCRVGDYGDMVTIDARFALNPRLLEAHEQLVVGQTVWFGDCMRRDPSKRDAFSQEKVGCSVTSSFAALSFEKLWALGTPAALPAAAETSTSVMSASSLTR